MLQRKNWTRQFYRQALVAGQAKNDFKKWTGLKNSKSQSQNKYSDLKSDYKNFKKIRDNRGFGWDSGKLMPTAPDSDWDCQ